MISDFELSFGDRFRFSVLIRSEIPVVYISLSEVYWANELLVLYRIFQYSSESLVGPHFVWYFSFIDKSIHHPQQVDPIHISYIHSKKNLEQNSTGWVFLDTLQFSWLHFRSWQIFSSIRCSKESALRGGFMGTDKTLSMFKTFMSCLWHLLCFVISFTWNHCHCLLTSMLTSFPVK